MITLRHVVLAGLIALGASRVAAETDAPTMELIMVEQDGCAWCARWNAEIGPIYPKTPEAAIAPLRRIDLHAPLPDDLTFDRPAVFTPTFVLVADGTEVGRIEGYPGPDFFWALLDDILGDYPQTSAN